METNKNILVFGETENKGLSPFTVQLLGIGRSLARALDQEVHLLLIGGEEQTEAGKEGFCYGADKVYFLAETALKDFISEAYVLAMEAVVEQLKPEIILFPQNDNGMDLAPRLAFRLKTGVTLDCVDLKVDQEDGLLLRVKPVFGGKAHGVYFCKQGRPHIVSVRDQVFEPPVFESSRSGEMVSLAISTDFSGQRVRLLGTQKDDSLSMTMKLASAEVVVSGGRGLKDKDGFVLLRETAELLNGTIAGSRPTVDYGWVPGALQVGLTGQKISPRVYMAVGISGAIQHMAGCLNSRTIIAINEDEEAPIFRMSHYGLVGDYKEALKAFNEEISLIKENS